MHFTGKGEAPAINVDTIHSAGTIPADAKKVSAPGIEDRDMVNRPARPTEREATLLSQKSSIELLFFFSGTIKQEKILHQVFEDKWVRGEWFSLTEDDLEFIKSI